MALIKCKGCGQMVSTRAERCPKCGYSVQLSMEREQEEAKPSEEIHSTTETENKEVLNNKPQQESSNRGIIIAIVSVVIIGSGIIFSLLQHKNSNQITQQTIDIPTIEAKLQNVQTVQEAEQLIEGTIWEHTVNTDESEIGYWIKVEFANGRYKTYYMSPSDDNWTNGGDGNYEIKEGKFTNTGEKYIAVYWEGKGYHGWPMKYALALNNSQITVRSAVPDLDALNSYQPQPSSSGYMKLVDVFEIGRDTGNDNESSSASEAIADEDKPNEFSNEITQNGVANIQIGKTFNDYNTSLLKKEEVEKLWYDFSIVDIKEDDSFDEQTYYMLMKIYKSDNLAFVLYGGYYSKRPTSLQTNIEGIAIYSSQFKLPNGIHVGMSAEELISKYGASINLCEGEGGEQVEYISFHIPNYEDYGFIADKEALAHLYGESFLRYWDSDGDRSEVIKKAVKEHCSLAAITIQEFPIDLTDGSTPTTANTSTTMDSSSGMATVINHALRGYMKDAKGEYPIELTFTENRQSNTLTDGMYKNVELGGKIRMDVQQSGDNIILIGKDGRNTFRISIDRNTHKGVATDGPKELSVIITDWA